MTAAEDASDLRGRVTILETSVERLDHRVERGFKELAGQVGKVADALAARPHGIPFKEIAVTVVACIGILSAIGGFLEWQFSKNTSVLEYRLLQLEKHRVVVPSSLVSR